MLTIIDIPREIADLYAQSKEIAQKIAATIAQEVPLQKFTKNTSLTRTCPSSVVIIQSGIFKYFYDNKFIRFYSNGDIVSVPSAGNKLPLAITSEFAAEMLVLNNERFLSVLRKDQSLATNWLEYHSMNETIMHSLTSLFAGEDFKPDVDIRQYQSGEVIIQEGDAPDNLFEMIEGKAAVSVKDTQVGTINAGEVFGEVSFLTESTRTATVIAESRCLIQAISGDQFEKIIKYRPTLVFSVSRTLANRLTEVNDRLIRISSLT
ncbi:MAG: cyclic nucleotide-binding domain-containing protein [Chitinivibrionales bacterium]|nr:cyclic nucleotide-binding domain-containing protein [Chitinivibrionales bacterium]